MRARVKYSKGEEVKYVGHLDTMRTFIRCIKRSAIPVEFSKGFNPRVQISFALPLGVGLTSESEYFDLVVTSQMNESIFLGELNSVLPQGFKALEVEFLDKEEKKSLMSLVKEAVYEITLEGNFSPSDIEELMEKSEILLQKESNEKHKICEFNLKELVLDYKVEKNGEEKVGLIIHSTAGSSNHMNPTYVIQAVEKYIGKVNDFEIHRKNLILK